MSSNNHKHNHKHHKHHHKKHQEETSALLSDDEDLAYDPLGEVPDARIGNPSAVLRHSQRGNGVIPTKSPKLPSTASQKKSALTITLITITIAILVSCILWARWTTSKAMERARQSEQTVVEAALEGAASASPVACDEVTVGVWLETCLVDASIEGGEHGMTLSILIALKDGSYMEQQIATPDDSHFLEYGEFKWEPDAHASRNENCQGYYESQHKLVTDDNDVSSDWISKSGSFTANSWNHHRDFYRHKPNDLSSCQFQRLEGKDCRHYAVETVNTLTKDIASNDVDLGEFIRALPHLC
mmetsp:Transcript_23827/g.54718  ORF Transcript_23827/g.54718 Transcript_23827/m.54718 type:complete len:300 (+) Transcript_23827:87-986(+)